MLLIPDCSDRTARKIDKHVLSVPLTLMMGRRYFFCRVGSIGTASVLKTDSPQGYQGRIQSYAFDQCFLMI